MISTQQAKTFLVRVNRALDSTPELTAAETHIFLAHLKHLFQTAEHELKEFLSVPGIHPAAEAFVLHHIQDEVPHASEGHAQDAFAASFAAIQDPASVAAAQATAAAAQAEALAAEVAAAAAQAEAAALSLAADEAAAQAAADSVSSVAAPAVNEPAVGTPADPVGTPADADTVAAAGAAEATDAVPEGSADGTLSDVTDPTE